MLRAYLGAFEADGTLEYTCDDETQEVPADFGALVAEEEFGRHDAPLLQFSPGADSVETVG